MAKVEGTEVIASDTGASDHIHLPAGEWTLHVTSESFGETTVEVADGAADRWSTVVLPNGETAITENQAFRVPGNNSYRLNVASVDDPIRLRGV